MHHATWQGADSPASPIETPRLLLLAATPAMIRADGDGNLAAAIDLIVPASWPPEHWDRHALDWLLNTMAQHPSTVGWCRFIALKSPGAVTLIGTCGCVGPPEATDDVEIGYSILPEFQRRGYATEAARALVDWVFQFAHVRSVNAQTFPHLAGSLGVMRNCGLTPAGEGGEPGAVHYRLMRG